MEGTWEVSVFHHKRDYLHTHKYHKDNKEGERRGKFPSDTRFYSNPSLTNGIHRPFGTGSRRRRNCKELKIYISAHSCPLNYFYAHVHLRAVMGFGI